jgi:hypothetical protein
MTDQPPNSSRSPEVVHDKEHYLHLIETGRNTLSDYHMDVLFTLYEMDSLADAAQELGKSEAELITILSHIESALQPKPRTERLTKKGKLYKKRLGRTAYLQILVEHEDLSDEERAVIRAIAEAPNQVVAAQSLGMTYKEFDQSHTRIRREHDF